MKSLTLLPLLVWIALLVYNGWRPHGLRNPMLFWAAVLYTLPFVVTNSDPRFRTSLEGVVFLDLARMVYQRFWPAKSAKVKARPVRLS